MMLKYLSLLTASTALLFTGEALAEDFQIDWQPLKAAFWHPMTSRR